MVGSVASVAWHCAMLALVLATATTARAQAGSAANVEAGQKSLSIDWGGPKDCDRGDAVRAKVLRLLGGTQRSLTADVKVIVTVRHESGSRYVAELETTSSAGGGSKRLEGESCDAIALASSVVIALSLDPNASLDATTSPEELPAAPAPKPKPSTARRRPQRAAHARETSPYVHGSVGVLFKLLSIPSAFTSVGIGVRHRRLSLELAGAVYQTRDVALAGHAKAGAELQLFSGELLGCVAALPFQLGALEACPGLRLEYLGADARGVSNPDRARVLLAAGLATLRGRLRPTSWLSATLDVGLAARPFHPTFVLLGVGDVFEIPVFSSSARTGLSLEF